MPSFFNNTDITLAEMECTASVQQPSLEMETQNESGNDITIDIIGSNSTNVIRALQLKAVLSDHF